MTNSLADELRRHAEGGRIPCALVCRVAASSGASLASAGEEANRAGLRITACQLGLFGYDEYGEKRWVSAPRVVPQGLEAALRAASVDGRLPCSAAWRTADDRGLPRLLVGTLADASGLRVSSCQLGCF